MMYEVNFPIAPSGPVWDVNGERYDKTEQGMWSTTNCSNARLWGDLLLEVGPVTDVTPLDLDVGRLYAVTTDDDPDKTYVCIRAQERYDYVYIVLPAEDYDKSIHIGDITACEPVAVVPPNRIGDLFDAFNWLKDNQKMQPEVVKDLGLIDTDGKD